MLYNYIQNQENWMRGNEEWSVIRVMVVSREILIQGFEDSDRNRNDLFDDYCIVNS